MARKGGWVGVLSGPDRYVYLLSRNRKTRTALPCGFVNSPGFLFLSKLIFIVCVITYCKFPAGSSLSLITNPSRHLAALPCHIPHCLIPPRDRRTGVCFFSVILFGVGYLTCYSRYIHLLHNNTLHTHTRLSHCSICVTVFV